MLELKQGNKHLLIGIPKERAMQENRVALTPEAVALLVNNGHEVWVEKGAGDTAKYTDQEYSNAGAQIKYTSKEVFEAEIVLKVEPPTDEEIGYIRPGKTLISALQVGNQKEEFIHKLNKKRITAIAFELLEDKVGGMPVVRAMSEIAGSAVMLIAAEYLSSTASGKGIILGGITGVPPTKVVILGAGTVGEYAARTALGLGAEVQVYDTHLYKLRRIRQSLGHHLYTSTLDPATVANSLKTADVVVGAIRAEKGRSKIVVTDQMVMSMKPGSIIIDVGIDQGGCVETSEITTHSKPVFLKHEIIHYCVPNIPSRVARTATQAFSNIFSPILLQAADVGGIDEMIFTNKWFMNGVYTYKGFLSNQHVARKFGLKHKDLSLLMAARN
ncbi:alanine dehydrogenase [Cesiribacter andamanensis]|uniref:alanine dehydrogenase n=1 Tax=Cesiribacter andamanensis AMV16 TaxID=1279009 RepID=M7NFP8_9BACT|nr:alanine dehydrogenase [Cesiribacter andamanensis]EMR00650.1 Alanine dehydrogenase 2 [Cesiribacter andamanensis AMV16]